MRIIIAILIIFLLHITAISQNNPAASEKVQAKINLLETWLNETIDYYHIPGLVIGVVYDQNLVWSDAFGYANLEIKEKMTVDHRFRIASISKTFTSTAIMQLRDTQKIRLDDPIEDYLSWFKIKNSFKNGPKVTIRQILTHTSGLPREAAYPYWTDHKFPTREQMINALPEQEMIYEPETKWKYSNLGMALLGEVISEVSGISYDEYVTKHILEPLKMKATSTQLDEQNQVMVAVGYLKYLPDSKRIRAPFTDSKGLTSAANLTSCVGDLAKFISTQFDNPNKISILKQSTWREMHRVQWLQPSWKSGWGLGFSISRDGDRVLVGHGGWVAGYRSQIMFSPEEKIGVICLINTEDYSPFKIAKQVMNTIAPAVKESLPKKESPVAYDPKWEKYIGKYEDPTFWETSVIILDKKLYLYGYSLPPEDDPGNGLTELFYEGKPDTFRMSGENGNGELVVFEMEKDKVKRIKIGENFVYPLDQIPEELR
jgi:CubicO group peptidase (beta-lactamase class C family)